MKPPSPDRLQATVRSAIEVLRPILVIGVPSVAAAIAVALLSLLLAGT
jgi:hypothetical protein